MKRLLVPLLLLSFLAACATPQTARLRASASPLDPPVLELKDVPFFPQDEHQCGPAALATVLTYSGKAVTPDQITGQVYLPGRQGSVWVELAAAARRQGRLAYPIAPQLEALLLALQNGFPVLVLQNNGLGFFPIWHYAVVVGADRRRERFILRSGTTERLEVPFATFERTWARANHWGLIAMDPTRLPDNLDSRMVVRELALMERAGAIAEAQAGFSRALQFWPEQKAAWLGLGSSSLQLGQPEKAEAALRELVRRAPEYGPGLNNLADLLLKTGRPMEALPLAEKAVAVLDIPATRATLQAASQALAPIQAEALPAQPGVVTEKVVVKPAKGVKKKVAKKKSRKAARPAAAKAAAKPGAKTATPAPAPKLPAARAAGKTADAGGVPSR
ncbi:MAG: PA2778 family cysteine peptidase [Pseudomonadota bacterium]